MMQRRLNKKVALIGSGIFILVLLAAIAVVFQLGHDPRESIMEAEGALKAAREATNEQEKQELYKRAKYAYGSAYDRAGDDELRKELLFKMADMYLETGEWRLVLGCWEQVIRLDPSNAQARYDVLKYLYITADNGRFRLWQQVTERATEFLEKVNSEDLAKDSATYDIPELRQDKDNTRRLESFLYLVRGKATLEMTRLGMVTDSDVSLAKAIADLKKVQELEPENIQTLLYLAQAAMTKGGIFASRGNLQERDRATEEAMALLEQAVAKTDSDPRATIELLALKLNLTEAKDFAQQKERIRSLEPEYVLLVEAFSTHAEAYAALSSFYTEYSTYSDPELRLGILKKAIEAAEKAMKLDEENAMYAVNAARLHYRLFSVYNETAEIETAIEIAKNALLLPSAQESTGPWQNVNRYNRYGLQALLAQCYIEQIHKTDEPVTSSKVREWLAGAEGAVHEIEQIFSSGEEPSVYKWRGMLELARGNKDAAVKDLYKAYEQFRAVMPQEPPWPRNAEFAHLSYILAGIFKDSTEIGAVHDFLLMAIYSGIGDVKPEAYLDYVDVLLLLNRWPEALQQIDAFEEYLGANQRSQSLRVQAYIGAMQFDEAETELGTMPANDVETMKLRLVLTQVRIRHIQRTAKPTNANDIDQLKYLRDNEADLLGKLLAMDPNAVDETAFMGVCRNFLTQGQLDRAGRLVDQFLKAFPDSVMVQVYHQILSEPDPANVSQQRLKEIEKQVLSGTTDPMLRALKLGIYYSNYNDMENATSQFKTAFDLAMAQEPVSEGLLFEQTKLVANNTLDIAIEKQDWALAENIVKAARTRNLDGCQGQVFAARLALAKEDYNDALVRANDCLEQKPIFSHGYMLRNHIQSALGNDHAAMEDIRRAVFLNPLDSTIVRTLASTLYYRNRKLGPNVSDAQVAETKNALLQAIALNPGDLGLRSLYADYITPIEPLKAVAIRQDLVAADPSLDNIILLGKLATEVAAKQDDPQTRQGMFDIAESAFEQAKQISPDDKRMLYYYAEYFRAKGQEDQAKALLEKSDEKTLLWNHYLQAGQYEDAQKVLQQLYDSGDRNGSVLRGLLFIAEKTVDIKGVKLYAGELVKTEDTLENHLFQIQAFLRVGLIKEADLKLQSFKEKYPNEPRSLLLEAALAMKQNKLDEAMDLANRKLQNDSDNPSAWRLRGEINFYRKEFDKAVSDLKKSKTLSDMPETRVFLAKTYLQMERYEDAITELRNAINAPGAPMEARSLLEHIYLQLGRKSELKTLYEDTLEKLPNDPYWLTQASAFALQTGKYDEAIDYIDKCIRHAESTDPARVDYIVKKGEVLTEVYKQTSDNNYLKTAITEYESLLGKMPNNTRVATVLNNLAYWLAETEERLSDALNYAKRALELEPKSPRKLDTYAYVLLKTGNASEADRFLTEALQRFEQNRIPVPADVYEHKGMIKEQLGEKQQARAAYEEALNVGEKSLS
ncbi:MAG: tetratricopeptide repeat protein, partial [Sedimentisphaerales bacterium]|nr:tetratricopeptide repeat protein [Sedimentisphaerales bacterium]